MVVKGADLNMLKLNPHPGKCLTQPQNVLQHSLPAMHPCYHTLKASKFYYNYQIENTYIKTKIQGLMGT